MSFENSTGTAIGIGAMPASYYATKSDIVKWIMCKTPQTSDDRDFFHMKSLIRERGDSKRAVSVKRRNIISDACVTPYPQPKRYNVTAK